MITAESLAMAKCFISQAHLSLQLQDIILIIVVTTAHFYIEMFYDIDDILPFLLSGTS